MIMGMFQKRRRGAANIVGIALTCIIVVLLLLVITLETIHISKALDSKNHISSCLRSYLNKMEVMGCLEERDIDALVEDLQRCGMTEIHISGNFEQMASNSAVENNYGPAEYGAPVYLEIRGLLKIKSVQKTASAGFFNFDLREREIEVEIEQKGISLR